MKLNIDYFGHEVDAIDHRKFLILRAYYGGDKGWSMEARFWALNCLIGRADNCKLNLSLKGEKARVARALELSLQDLDAFILVLKDEAELIHCDDGVVWTDKTQEDLDRALKVRQEVKNRRNKNVGRLSADNSQMSADNSQMSADKNHQCNAMQCNTIQGKARQAEALPPAAAAVVTTQEVAKALETCSFASRLTTGDHEVIAQRLSSLKMPIDFVRYCVDRTKEAKPKSPGGFLRSALYGNTGFTDYPQAYLEASTTKPQTSSRPAAPKLCEHCKTPLKIITDEAVCPECGAAWYWDEDWQSWEQSEESWQGFDAGAGLDALRAKAEEQKQSPDKQAVKQTA